MLGKNQQDAVRRINLIQNLMGCPREVDGHPRGRWEVPPEMLHAGLGEVHCFFRMIVK